VKSPWLAWCLSVIPGLGQVYNGLTHRALVQFTGWVAFIFLLQLHFRGLVFAALVLGWLAFWFWSSIDAYQTAVDINRTGRALTEDEARALGHGPILGIEADSHGFGVALCVIGALLLARNFAGVIAAWMRFLVPLALIAGGAWIVHRSRSRPRLDDGTTIDLEPEAGA
jgi:hypothetical protein